MKFTTLIPLTRNDGSRVRRSELSALVESLWRPFGGMTEEGHVTGHWIAPPDGTHFQDTCLKVSIETDRERLPDAIAAVKRIGRALGQRAMYFEVSGYDGVQFLRIE
ncbi:MAG: hypothetical protein HYS13_25495 [Planctomycetia bacterium]|nr:hypothetical protein [Planctomycetia bacterium]